MGKSRTGLILGIGLVLMLMAGILGRPWLILAVLLVTIMVLALNTMFVTAQKNSEDVRESMDAEGRSLYSPIRRTVEEIEQIVAKHSDSPIMKVVGGEAVREAERIRDQVAKALGVRDDLKRALREKSVAMRDIEQLESQLAAADDLTRPALKSALEARQMELSHYTVVEEALLKIDSGVTQAKAALSEMKARLSVKASNEKAQLNTDDGELRETISRMRALSISYDEAEQLLQP